MRENIKKKLELLTGYMAGVGIIGFSVFMSGIKTASFMMQS